MMNSEVATDNSYFNENDNKSQPQIKQFKYHSILPDLATGWRPKNAKIAAPIFITYQDALTEEAFQSAVACMNKLVYIGPRHDNSYKFHSLTQHSYNVKYGIKCQQVPSKLKKQLEQFTIKSNSRKGLFTGMNSNLEKQLQFDSNFQSGNLDLVVKISANQYNIFLRPDTNTRGHMQWFYFKISNQFYSNQKIRLNICNNRKFGVLFSRGMKPYVYSKHLQTNKGTKWYQGGENVQYKRLSQKQDYVTNFLKQQSINTQFLSKYHCLSFDYTFQTPNDQVYFAYCPPYSYSDMKSHIQSIKKKSNPEKGLSINQQCLCTSLTGLQIPVLTITDQKIQQSQKKCIIVTGRFHPGQSNGSYVLKGFLDYLVSSDGQYLRKKAIFKIIPMINPDGVVFGNYRTSLSGKDLNRKFKAKNDQLFPEVVNLKNFVTKLKRQSKLKLLYFLDFHGHSMKKNVFLYGPEYDIWSTKFQRARILPKIISGKTNMFRYQSCLFRVAATKKTTARAFMLGLVPYCYTIQSSVGLYKPFNFKQSYLFQPSKWQQMGQIIADSLKQSLARIQKQKQSLLITKKKKKSIQPTQFQINKQNFNNSSKNHNLIDEQESEKNKELQKPLFTKSLSRQSARQALKQKQKQKINQKQSQQERQKSKNRQQGLQIKRTSSSRSIRHKQTQLSPSLSIQTIKNLKNPLMQTNCPQINQVQNQSDGYSQGKSDCQSDDNDFDKEQYKKISGKIMKFIQNFNMSIIGQRRNKIRVKNRKKVVSSNNTNSGDKLKFLNGLRKNSTPILNLNDDIMRMVPSLKHKMMKKETQSKKNLQQKEQISFKVKKTSIYKFQEQKKK